ncbi:MAG TPA: M14 family zinc carboxypeptidase [Fimbriimonadaceae bacterium]|nr:M14 family zinc carboxypeptidase [Fimbriimonadaceae bacterium]HRJ96838.1 M14 family zinc carboxypeptidase [Fimbriimonadaceae bacterium]
MLLQAILTLALTPANWPTTRAERSGFTETSTYEDVVQFLGALQQCGSPMTLEWIGESVEGRSIPLAILSWPPVTTPLEAKRTGRPVVYVQANIHAGEVEGKEAAQTLLRRLSQEAVALAAADGRSKPSNTLVDKFVFLVDPIYNLDGNEKFGPAERNRPGQDGPAQVGVRANAQNFDLNRDCIKAESPEMRAALEAVYVRWDPDVVFDLHTTNGTRHGFEHTYAPPTNPNTDPGVLRYSRDALMPWVRREYRKRYGQEIFDYGNAVGSGNARRWETFGHEGRYVSNYVGLRNRIGILSEAVSFLPFRDRVVSTERFVDLCLSRLALDARRVLDLSREADRRMVEWSRSGPELGLRFEMGRRASEDTVSLERPPARPGKRPAAVDWLTMPVFDRWAATKRSRFPSAYLLPPAQTAAVDLLRRHGAVVRVLEEDWTGLCDRFDITKASQANQAFQGHRLWTLEGEFRAERTSWPKGSFLVQTGQPLGVLIFHILEPESTDGAATWGFLGDFVTASVYPAQKVFGPIPVRSSVMEPRSH